MKAETVQSFTLCYHCGEETITKNFQADGHHFCCAGCLGVYTILSENQMCTYYAYNDMPGKRSNSNHHFDYLDDDIIVKQLVNYQDQANTVVTFYVPAVHCSSCIWLLEHLYKINKAIFNSRIDFLKKEVTISFKTADISLREVVETLAQIGYEPSITLQDVVKANQQKSTNKTLLLQIAVAGFCMANSMLFSFPEYFGLSGVEEQFQELFGWLNFALCIPATLFCAKDYFKSAITSLKHGLVNLDTPLALIVLVLFLRTGFSVSTNNGPGFADTLTGLVFLLLMGKYVKQRTYHHISFDRDYRSYFPIAVTALVAGVEKPKAISEIKIGDRLWIRNGELIPADAILMRGEAWLDMSFVTGETEPQRKILGEMIYAGGKQMGEGIEVEIVKNPSQSYLTNLWNKDNYKQELTQNFNDSVAKYFSLGVFLTSFLSMAYWFYNADASKAWNAFTAVIIVACPCVLALSSPFTLSAILSVFDKKGFYVKSTDALEEFIKCNTLVFDKTGTLTTTEAASISFTGSLTRDECIEVASLLQHSSHPLSRQILKHLKVDHYLTAAQFSEIPGKGIMGSINDKKIALGSGALLPANVSKMSNNGVHVVVNDIYKGTFLIDQTWRPFLKQLLKKLSSQFDLLVLSGDSNRSEKELKLFFDNNAILKFGQSPKNKLDQIISLQNRGEKVLMIGDGLNDAGALKQSNFGIAITDNINNFTPGCDAILQGESLRYLPQFYKLGKKGISIIKISFGIATAYNCIGLYFAVQGTLYPLVAAVLMPISTVTIITFTTITTRFFAKKHKLI